MDKDLIDDSTGNGEEIEQESNENAVEKDEVKPLSQRDLIVANREEQLLKEVAESVGNTDNEKQPDDEPVKTVQIPESVKIKVDGLEEDVPLDELKRHYQKSSAADRRLQQAALEKKQLEDERLELEQQRFLIDQERQALSNVQTIAPISSIEELKLKRRDALEIGDYDEFDRIDEEISQARSASFTFDSGSIASQAAREAQSVIQYEAAFEKFSSKNDNLLNDPVLYNIAMTTFNNMCQDSSSYSEAFEKTELAMKDWLKSVSQSEPVAVDAEMTDRKEKKKAIPAEPGRLSVKSTPPPAQKEETASDIIANMRKARGLHV